MPFRLPRMALSSQEDEFVEVASAALPRIIEIIAAFPTEDRAGALEVAERRYTQATRGYGCTHCAAPERGYGHCGADCLGRGKPACRASAVWE
jgi:hypothetical protein